MAEWSPLIAQYLALKAQYPEAMLLSRVGDFYEAYGDDATELANALNIVCTSKEAGRGQRVAMAGVPHHAVDHYLGRLLRQRRREVAPTGGHSFAENLRGGLDA